MSSFFRYIKFLQRNAIIFFPLASRNVSDWWLAHWISHSRVTNSTADHLNSTTKYNLNHVILSALNPVQSGLSVHIVKNTVTFYLLVYGGLAVANTVSLILSIQNMTGSPFRVLTVFFISSMCFAHLVIARLFLFLRFVLRIKFLLIFAFMR